MCIYIYLMEMMTMGIIGWTKGGSCVAGDATVMQGAIRIDMDYGPSWETFRSVKTVIPSKSLHLS
jgi:hypothetical protein